MTDKKSTPHKDSKIIQERRQEEVARLMVRGLSARAITDDMAKRAYINPNTGDAWSDETIRLDMKAVQRRWKASTKQSVETHRARQMAELAEIKREAWNMGRPDLALTALSHEAKLTDTAAPLRINLSLVSDLWDAFERRGLNPESMIKAMILELAVSA